MVNKESQVGKYSRLVKRAFSSVEYWTQTAMRQFVTEVLRRMDASDMSKADLAKALESSPAYVSKILRGDVNFTLETMTKLAMAVGGRIDVRIADRDLTGALRPAQWHIEVGPRRVSHVETVLLELDQSHIAANEQYGSPQFYVYQDGMRRAA